MAAALNDQQHDVGRQGCRDILIGVPGMKHSPVYPHIRVKFLIGNVPPFLAAISLGAALKNCGVEIDEIGPIVEEVIAADPDDVMAVCARYVHVR
jgi:hypothetical protein